MSAPRKFFLLLAASLLLGGCVSLETMLAGLRSDSVSSGPVTAPLPQSRPAAKEPPASVSPSTPVAPVVPVVSVAPVVSAAPVQLQKTAETSPGKEPGQEVRTGKDQVSASRNKPHMRRVTIDLPGRSNADNQTTAKFEPNYRNAVLAEDTQLRGEVLVEGSLTVPPQVTLTVEPGTVVRFRRGPAPQVAVLLVQGRIVVNGTNDNPVSFLPEHPQSQAGNWLGIMLLASEKKNLLEHVRIEGAEIGIEASFSTLTVRDLFLRNSGVGLKLVDSIAQIHHAHINACSLGMELRESEVDLRQTVLGGNRQGMLLQRSSLFMADSSVSDSTSALPGLTAEDSTIKLTGCLLERNSSGIALSGAQGAIAGSRIASNREDGIQMSDSRVRLQGNEIAGNGVAGLRVEDGQGIAWGNSFQGNGKYDIINAGGDDFNAIGNWFSDGGVAARIIDRARDGKFGEVRYLPLLATRPDPVRAGAGTR